MIRGAHGRLAHAIPHERFVVGFMRAGSLGVGLCVALLIGLLWWRERAQLQRSGR
jgi:hypothetical protein